MGEKYTQEEYAIFQKLDRAFLWEDIEYIAEDMGVELTDEDMTTVIEIYDDTESIDRAKRTTIENAILRVKGE